jgi:hypothetical protein
VAGFRKVKARHEWKWISFGERVVTYYKWLSQWLRYPCVHRVDLFSVELAKCQ